MKSAPAVLILLLFTSTSTFGQEAVKPGDRIKIRTADSPQTIIGTVQAMSAERIDLLEGGSVSRSSIRTLHRNDGMARCTKRGALIGAVVGAVGGAFGSRVCSTVGCESGPCPDACEFAFLEGAALGIAPAMGMGALIGSLFKRERWTDVRLSITASPGVSGGNGSSAIAIAWAW